MPPRAAEAPRAPAERRPEEVDLIQAALATNRQNQVLAGTAQFARESGTPSYKGTRVNLARFAEWAQGHLGIPGREIQETLQALQRRGTLQPSALGADEVIVPDGR